jgi:isopropylmalate/homocitrate/citramalate synthase
MDLHDLTLREGDQMPGRSYTADQKVRAARALDRLGLAVVQAGFPATGEVDRETIRRLSGDLDATLVALARAVERDVDHAADAGADAVDVFTYLSERQLEHVVGKSREEMLAATEAAVDHARDRGLGVQVSLVDAFRTDLPVQVAALERFADVPLVSLPDSVGAATPATVDERLAALGERVDLSRVGVHFHEDLGCGAANTLVANGHGVAKADVAVASLGERAGNAPLEQVVAGSATDRDDDLGLAVESLIPVCREVLDALGESVDPRTPVLGEEPVTHESGVHTAAMLDEPGAFEPFDPADFGGRRRLLFGANSGRGAAARLLERAGLAPTDDRVSRALDLLATEGPLETEAAVALLARRLGEA